MGATCEALACGLPGSGRLTVVRQTWVRFLLCISHMVAKAVMNDVQTSARGEREPAVTEELPDELLFGMFGEGGGGGDRG